MLSRNQGEKKKKLEEYLYPNEQLVTRPLNQTKEEIDWDRITDNTKIGAFGGLLFSIGYAKHLKLNPVSVLVVKFLFKHRRFRGITVPIPFVCWGASMMFSYTFLRDYFNLWMNEKERKSFIPTCLANVMKNEKVIAESPVGYIINEILTDYKVFFFLLFSSFSYFLFYLFNLFLFFKLFFFSYLL